MLKLNIQIMIIFSCLNILTVVLETDRPDPKLQNAEIKYVPEQM